MMVKSANVDWGWWGWAGVIVALLVAMGIGGCAQLLKLQGQSAEKAAQAIEAYCDNTDADFRAQFRAEVNAKAFPNSAEITCAAQ